MTEPYEREGLFRFTKAVVDGWFDPLIENGVIMPVVDETLNTLAKSLDDGYEWEQLIPRLMNLPPDVVLYREATPAEWVTGKAYAQDMPVVRVWPEVPDGS